MSSAASVCCCQRRNRNIIPPRPTFSLHRWCRRSPPAAPMKDHRRGAGFPFSIGCMSQSAIAVVDEKKQPSQADPPSSSPTTATQEKGRRSISEKGRPSVSEKGSGEEAGGVSEEKGFAAGVQRLIKGFKSLTQMFGAYEEEEEEEEEREIVIGYPTDVQHIGHIGWDGTNKVGAMDMGMGMVSAFSLPSSLSIHHLEAAMDQTSTGTATTCAN